MGDVDAGEVFDKEEGEPGAEGEGKAKEGEGESATGLLDGFLVGAGGEPFVAADDEHDKHGQTSKTKGEAEDAGENCFKIANGGRFVGGEDGNWEEEWGKWGK